MAVRSTKPISLSDVRAEFGAPAGTPLHDFKRGGAWVPSTRDVGTTRNPDIIFINTGVPTSPPISLSDLLGATKT